MQQFQEGWLADAALALPVLHSAAGQMYLVGCETSMGIAPTGQLQRRRERALALQLLGQCSVTPAVLQSRDVACLLHSWGSLSTRMEQIWRLDFYLQKTYSENLNPCYPTTI